jgi:hypothetical protein
LGKVSTRERETERDGHLGYGNHGPTCGHRGRLGRGKQAASFERKGGFAAWTWFGISGSTCTRRQGIWDTDNWQQFQEHIHWIRVAASDPRVNLDKKVVEGFVDAVEEARVEYRKSAEASGPEYAYLPDEVINEVERTTEELDKLAVERLKKLA